MVKILLIMGVMLFGKANCMECKNTHCAECDMTQRQQKQKELDQFHIEVLNAGYRLLPKNQEEMDSLYNDYTKELCDYYKKLIPYSVLMLIPGEISELLRIDDLFFIDQYLNNFEKFVTLLVKHRDKQFSDYVLYGCTKTLAGKLTGWLHGEFSSTYDHSSGMSYEEKTPARKHIPYVVERLSKIMKKHKIKNSLKNVYKYLYDK